MPLYEYECKTCGEVHPDIFSSVADRDKQACPSCGSCSMKRNIPQMSFTTEVPLSDYTPGELAMALRQKKHIEANADRLRSGAMEIKDNTRVPRELRPNIPKERV